MAHVGVGGGLAEWKSVAWYMEPRVRCRANHTTTACTHICRNRHHTHMLFDGSGAYQHSNNQHDLIRIMRNTINAQHNDVGRHHGPGRDNARYH